MNSKKIKRITGSLLAAALTLSAFSYNTPVNSFVDAADSVIKVEFENGKTNGGKIYNKTWKGNTAEDGSVVIQKVPNQKYLYYFLLRSSSKDIPLKLTEGKAYGFYDGQLYQLNAQFYIHDTSKGVLPLGYESGVEFSDQVVNGWLNPLPAQGQRLELVMVLDEYPDYLDQPDQFLLELTYQPAGFAASLLPDSDTAPRTVRLWSE